MSNNPAALRPKYGEALGRAAQGGRVIATDQFEQFLDALVFGINNAQAQTVSGAGGLSRGQALALAQEAIAAETPAFREISADHTATGLELLRVTAGCTITLGAWGRVTVWVDTTAPVTVTDGVGSDVLELRGTVISYRYLAGSGWVRGA